MLTGLYVLRFRGIGQPQKLVDLKVGNGDFCGYVFSFAEGRRQCSSTVKRVKDGPVSSVPAPPLAPPPQSEEGTRRLRPIGSPVLLAILAVK